MAEVKVSREAVERYNATMRREGRPERRFTDRESFSAYAVGKTEKNKNGESGSTETLVFVKENKDG